MLIIGSLLWDGSRERQSWKRRDLNLVDAVRVTASIAYGRRSESRGNTFTMTWNAASQPGTAVFAPLSARPLTAQRLVDAARAIWAAERQAPTSDRVSARWGSVGVLVRSGGGLDELRDGWTREFRRCGTVIPPIDGQGFLKVPWPVLNDGSDLDTDIILTTATRADAQLPTPAEVADAWLRQTDGYEEYFFNNVRDGIRTSDDIAIWARIREASPAWLKLQAYELAVSLLERDAAKAENTASTRAGQQPPRPPSAGT